MKMSNNYKKELEQLEKDCITNSDSAFNRFLLMDVSEVGYADGLFTELDYYLFWLTKAQEINFILNDLIGSAANQELMIKAIVIKRVVDANLIKHGKSEQDILADLGLGEERFKIERIELKYEGADRLRFLKELHAQLKKDGYIECTLNHFSTNFNQSGDFKRINWIGKQKQLLGLFKFFLNKKIILLRNRVPSHVVADHFTVNGENIKPKSVGVTFSNVSDDEYEYPAYNAIINSIT